MEWLACAQLQQSSLAAAPPSKSYCPLTHLVPCPWPYLTLQQQGELHAPPQEQPFANLALQHQMKTWWMPGFHLPWEKNKCTWTTNRHRGHTHACNQESVSLPLESVSSDSDSEPSSPVTRTMANICKAKNGNMDLEWVSWQWCRCFWFQRIADDGVAWVIQNNAGYIQHMLNACAVVSDACRSQKLSKELSHTWERVHQSHRNFRMQFFPNTLMQMTTSCMWRNILSPCGKTLINMHVKRNHACMTNRVTDAAEILASWKG